MQKMIKYNLRNVVAIAICLAGIAMFSDCSKPDPEPDVCEPEPNLTNLLEINATNVNGSSSDIATVTVFKWKEEEIASVEYKDGGFKLNLPVTLPDKYLSPAWFEGAIISDKEAQICKIDEFLAYNSIGERIGQFYYYADNFFGLYAGQLALPVNADYLKYADLPSACRAI